MISVFLGLANKRLWHSEDSGGLAWGKDDLSVDVRDLHNAA